MDVYSPQTPADDPAARKVHFGTCAWSFDDWRGVFYPVHLAAGDRLEFYARFLDSVEIDSTFYAPPKITSVRHWLDATPDGFLFAAKMTREITHDRKLRDCADVLPAFLASLAPLRAKLACVLVQLPPFFTAQHGEHALREFVRALPQDFRFAIEFRDESWHHPRIAHLLEENRVCWVWNDLTPITQARQGAFDYWPRTTDFLYVRLLGDQQTKYGGDGSRLHKYRGLVWPRDASLDSWRARVSESLADVSRALIMTNNHFEGFSPHTCQRIAERFGVAIHLPSVEERAGSDSDAGQIELL